MNRRGIALMHVLVLALLALVLCSSLIGSRMQPAVVAAGAVDRVRDDLAGQAAINRVTEVWARQGTCGSDQSAGVSCGSGGGCNCTCVVEGAGTVLSRPSPGGVCSLTASR